MVFDIFRTSDCGKGKPCDGAYSTGKGSWMIEINSLEDLLTLSDSVGCPIIFARGSIELYDDLRE